MDRDLGSAVWATVQDEEEDGWIERFVGLDALDDELDSFLPGAGVRFRIGEAVAVEPEPPEIEVLEDMTGEGVRSVRLAIRSLIGAEQVQVHPAAPGSVVLLAVNGKWIPPAAAAGDWLLQHWGQPADAITLLLESTTPDEPIELVLVEHVLRLPRLPRGPDVTRPPELAPNVRTLTDRALYRQVVIF